MVWPAEWSVGGFDFACESDCMKALFEAAVVEGPSCLEILKSLSP